MMRCRECGHEQAKWAGSCPQCRAWNAFDEVAKEAPSARKRSKSTAAKVGPLGAGEEAPALHPTGFSEVDRVLGGGIVRGSVVLLSGAPGIGKSTLLLKLAESFSQAGLRPLYVSGEETGGQVAARAARLGIHAEIDFAAETDLGAILARVEESPPALLIIDSIQTLSSRDLPGSPGSVQQVREASELLRTACKRLGVTTVLVGHVTKDGSIAGPKMLEHMVDVVLTVEGDARSGLRIVSSSKNRYGPTQQIGVLELTQEGLRDVPDPALLFLEQHDVPEPGVALGAALDGQRLYLTEIQALVVPSRLPAPRRVITALDPKRVELLIAVLDRHAGTKIGTSDVFLTLVGGLRLPDPGLDLAVALALASAAMQRPLPKGLVACGEVSLTGEVRPPAQAARRIEHLARLGFPQVRIPVERERPQLAAIVAELIG